MVGIEPELIRGMLENSKCHIGTAYAHGVAANLPPDQPKWIFVAPTDSALYLVQEIPSLCFGAPLLDSANMTESEKGVDCVSVGDRKARHLP